VDKRLRYVLVLVGFLIYAGRNQQPIDAAPRLLDWCDVTCGEEASCGTHCLWAVGQDPVHEYTCGTYDGGPANDHCDGDGCATECSWWSAGGDVCWWNGEESTCEDYGLFGICTDGYCNPAMGENCSTCEEDCGCPPSPPPVCGNNNCEVGETFRTCPLDCYEPEEDVCGDEICGSTEDGANCPEDCNFSGDYCGNFGAECPEGWDCVNDVCTWHVTHYVCCGPNKAKTLECAHTPLICTATEKCALLPDADPDNDVPVCQKRWSFQSGG